MTNLEEYNEAIPINRHQFLKDSPTGRLILLALLALVGSLILSITTVLISKIFGVDISQLMQGQMEKGNNNELNALRMLLVLNSLMVFIIPAYIYNYIVDRNYLKQLAVEQSTEINYWTWAFMLFVLSLPLVIASAWANQQIELPTWAQQSEDNINNLIETLLSNGGILTLIFNLTVMAFLPALGEEWFFRASLQRLLANWFKKEWLAIFITGFLFSLLHFQFEGFLPRFLLGLVLGFIFSKTRNIWVSVFLHFLFNGVQIVAAYYHSDKLNSLNKEQIPVPNWWIVSICSIITCYLIYNFPKYKTDTDEYKI